MDSREHSQHINRYEQLKVELMTIQQYRDFMPMYFPTTPNRDGIYWNHYEMLTMLRHVNQYRDKMGKSMLDFTHVQRVESQASGHSDYTSKFALYCAELILED